MLCVCQILTNKQTQRKNIISILVVCDYLVAKVDRSASEIQEPSSVTLFAGISDKFVRFPQTVRKHPDHPKKGGGGGALDYTMDRGAQPDPYQFPHQKFQPFPESSFVKL